jgi:hypothetical protein
MKIAFANDRLICLGIGIILLGLMGCQSRETIGQDVSLYRKKNIVKMEHHTRRERKNEAPLMYRMDMKGMAFHSTLRDSSKEKLQEFYEQKLYPDLDDWNIVEPVSTRPKGGVFSIGPDDVSQGADVDIILIPSSP